MEQRLKNKQKSQSSVEALIKQAIISLKETPGPTFTSIAEHIKGKQRNVGRKEVLEAMKKMRKAGQVVQIKCYFRIPAKEIKMQLRKCNTPSANTKGVERKSYRTVPKKAKKHTSTRDGIKANNRDRTQIRKQAGKQKKKEDILIMSLIPISEPTKQDKIS
eukprot:TRINITY_DN13832_c0_g1_i4.p1 TRINITY_DN13832_c0_g1~~TRINITY_DN13832_c0_g1_i4.p1  ORF type:complete len:161 (-),score=31.09 TRINITY_DN13832_c0_g1_i4:39-521(-)